MRKGWEVKRLGEVTLQSGTVDPTKSPDKTFRYVDVSSVSNQTFEIEETSEIIGRDAPSRARRQIKSGDVIFATIRPTLKRIAIVPPHLDGEVCSTGYFVFRPKPNLDRKFLYYHLFTDAFIGVMERIQTGASYPAVNDTQVKEQTIAFPSLPEQKRIVAILDEAFEGIGAAVANAEKNLANARELFENYLNSVFARKGEGWAEKTLQQVSVSFGRGRSKHRPRNDPKLYGGPYPFIQTGDVRNCDHVILESSQSYNEIGLAQSKLWPKGTICITIAANIAETGILGFDACFPDSVIGMVADEAKTTSEFVEYLLQSMKAHLKAHGKGSAQDNINLATFEKQLFPFPPLDEQERLVVTLNDLSDKIQGLETVYSQKIDALSEIKQSILQKAFAGELPAQPEQFLREAVA